MRRLLPLLVASLALCIAAPAHAAFHLFRIAEFFTSADGCVQFIRLHEVFGGDFQDRFGGLTITCSDGVTTNSFTFPTNLSSTATANSSVLLATGNFAALAGGIAPDFIIPAGFILPGGGTINFASGVDMATYGPMPTDGQTSVLSTGATQPNTPRNFSMQSGSVNVPPGACCNGTACTSAIAACCSGQFTPGGVCQPSPCAPAGGVCCSGATCRASAPAACTGPNTLFVATSACNAAGNNASPCCRADFNHAAGITVGDIFDFLNLWFSSSPTADFDGNGAAAPTVSSIFSFLNAWFAGC